MDSRKTSVIIASIYYSRANWQTFISFIYPYLNQIYRSGILEGYYMQFSRHRGDHIRLIAQPSTLQHQEKVQEMLSKTITAYLSNFPSDSKKITYPISNFFMDYPNNSVWINHNRAHRQDHARQRKENEDMQMQISQAFIAAFEQEEMTLENICTFMIYLQLGMIKACHPTVKLACEITTDLIGFEKKNALQADDNEGDQSGTSDFFQQMLEENHSLLVNIVSEVWELDGSDNGLKWMKIWEKNFQQFAENSAYSSAFFTVSGLVYGQLNFISVRSLPLLSLKLIARILYDMENSVLNVAIK